MSTDYYKLPGCITSVRREPVGSHVYLTIFVNHANAGTLCVRKEEERNLLGTLFCIELGTSSVNFVVNEIVSDSTQLMSEYGDLTTFGQVKGIREPILHSR